MTRPEVAQAILQDAERRGVTLRALGGVAVQIRCASARAGRPLWRECGDIDLATTRRSAAGVKHILVDRGYEPVVRFNALHGRSRLLFEAPHGDHADVFVDTFSMCHVLDLQSRLGVDSQTLSLADLLLTKLQIAELNRKDVSDAAAIFLDHDLATDDSGINVPYVEGVLCGDWGWWRTVSANLSLVLHHLPRLDLDERDRTRVQRQTEKLLERVEAAPKTRKWKLRARIGERMPWREEPEEVAT
jgi:hypothetical protein